MRRALLSLAFSLFAVSSFAQTTGFPPYGSFDEGGFDAVNRQNLNVNLAIPIVSTAGRGIGFNFSIVYDSLLWQNIGFAWTSVTNPAGTAIWGWKATSPIGAISYTFSHTSVLHRCSIDYYDYKDTDSWSNYAHTDVAGTPHSFTVTYRSVYDACTGLTTTSGASTGYATDASGYYINIVSPDAPLVQSRSGISRGLEDTNGNFISNVVLSSTETDWKDTAGHTALRIVTVAPNIEYHYLDTNGTDQKYTLRFKDFTVQTNFACQGVTDYNVSGTLPLVSLPYQLDLPNNKTYVFGYELTPGVTQPQPPNPPIAPVRLQQFTLPTSGFYQYTYPTTAPYGINCADGTVTSITKTINDGTTSATRDFTRDLAASTTKVKAPQLPYDTARNETVFTFSSAQVTSQRIYQGAEVPANLKRTINTLWATNGTPASNTVILEDGATQAKTETDFDTFGNLLDLREFDWGGTVPVRRKTNTYLATAAYTDRNIRNRLTQTIIRDSASVKSRTDIVYDEPTYSNTSCPLLVPQHDDSYSCTFYARGNPTTVTKYTDPITPAGGIAQHISYDFFGNTVVADMNCCQQVQWIYSTATNYAYPDSVKRGPLGNQLITSATYNAYTGQVATSTDENGKVSSSSYSDPGHMNRLTSITRPDNAQITYSYDDTARTVVVPTPIQDTNVLKQLSAYDQLGRAIKTTLADSSQTSFSITESQYDPVGRAYKVSNPHNSTAQYWSETRFDALGRPLKIIPPDGSSTSNNATYSYATNTATVTDPAGKQKKSQLDAIGHLTKIFEDPGTLNYETDYAYDVFDNLTGVTQGAQLRTYNYDALSRLANATTPEAGQVSYEYDPVFYTLVTKRTDARGVKTNYSYDTLNRLKQTSYDVTGTSVPATPTVILTYGTDSAQNNNGRLLTMTDGAGSENYSYDPFGRTTRLDKVISGTTYTTQYAYNLSGEPTSITYPSLRVVQQRYDAVGRLCAIAPTAADCAPTNYYAKGFGYNVAQQVTGFNSGDGVAATFGYSPDRLQMTGLGYANAVQTLFSLNYWYKQDATNCAGGAAGNNGQIQCIQDTVNQSRTTSYTYDALARLKTASDAQWSTITERYDRYGHRESKSAPVAFNQAAIPTTNHLPSPYAYDAAGNMTNDAQNTLTYDAANHIISTASGFASGSYTYDGNGLRVKRVAAGGVTANTVYVFSGSKVIAEYDNGAAVSTPSREYIYSGSQLVATIEGTTTTYHHPDHLSTRVSTDVTGAVTRTVGYFPFGEVWYETGTASKWKFTTYERDNESGNDYAMMRYDINRLARFNSPDALGIDAADTSNPQSWNAYAYVMNNPTNFVDPLGLILGPPLPQPPPRQPPPIEGFWCTTLILYFPFGNPTCSNRLISGEWEREPKEGKDEGPKVKTKVEPKVEPKALRQGTCANGFGSGGIGIGLGGNFDAGVGAAGVSATAGLGGGLFHNKAGGLTSGWSGGGVGR